MQETQRETRADENAPQRLVHERRWIRAGLRGTATGVLTGIIASVTDLLSVTLAHAPQSGAASTWVRLASLMAPLFAVAGALAALWGHGVVHYLQRPGLSTRTRVWLASALLALPLTAAVLWVPWSWLTEHWKTLSRLSKASSILIYCGVFAAGIIVGRALLWARECYETKGAELPRLHWALIASSAGAGALFYWADLTQYVDLYDHFHYGLAGGFVVSAASFSALVWTAVERRSAAKRLHEPTGVVRACLTSLLFACGLLATQEVNIRDPRALVFSKAVRGLQSVTDFDGDGHSTFLGSTDCAPLDRTRSPSEIDLPGNGIDEDCNGIDSSRWPKPARPGDYGIPKLQGLNLLFITVDALRADRLGVYGNRRNISPSIDRLAEGGVVFVNAYSQASNTYNSVPSLFTGLYPANLPRDYNSKLARSQKRHVYTLTEDVPLLTELIKARGYQTHAVTTIGLLRNLGLYRGFDGYEKTTTEVRKANQVTAKANAFLASARQPFFLWLHYDEPHDPYDRYPEFPFGGSDRDLYDGEVSAVDRQIGQLLDQLENSQLAEKTLIVLTADHGEEFREHGGQYHTEKLHRELLHVPLILKAPGLTPRREEQLVELVDVLPSLCEGLQLREDCQMFDGQSLWATLAGQRDNGFGFRGAYAEVMMHDGVLQRRSLLTDEYRFNIYLDTQAQELFDVRLDPTEQRNLAQSRPDTVARMQNEMSLRPYRRLGPLFEQATSGDSTGLSNALPRIRSESMLRFALEAIARHPCPGARLAFQNLTTRPGLSAEMLETVSLHLSRLPR